MQHASARPRRPYCAGCWESAEREGVACGGRIPGFRRLCNGMRPTRTGDYVRDFLEEVLRTGSMLMELLDEAIESLPDDAYPGESIVDVVFEMLTGTIRPAAEAAGETSVRSAVALLAASRLRALADLDRAGELARRRERGLRGVSWERRPG